MTSEDEFTKKRKLDVEEKPIENLVAEHKPLEEISISPPKFSHDALRKILTFLTEDQAMQMLLEACITHTDVRQALSEHVGRANSRKVFIRGLGYDVTSEDLKLAFQEYGELEEALVITEKGTTKSRGFGFVTFRDITSCLVCLNQSSITINGRIASYNLAANGAAEPPSGSTGESLSSRKIYIGNVPFGCSADSILRVFSKFGAIEEGPIGLDKATKQSKGYALILYESPEAAKRAMDEPNKEIEGRAVYCKLATEGSVRHRNQTLQKQQGGGEAPVYNFTQPTAVVRYQPAEGDGLHPGGSILGQPGPAQVLPAPPYPQYVAVGSAQGQPQTQYIIAPPQMGQSQPFDAAPQVQYPTPQPRPPVLNPPGVYAPQSTGQAYFPAGVPVPGQGQGVYPGQHGQGQPQQVYENQQVVIQPGQYFVSGGGGYGLQGPYQ